ncbi:ABC transporter permease [Pseudomonas syringae]|uniref:ABC transporter permease n=1 Tax=Pseudomonas syringae TaxID=317 RepID=A0A244EPF6_PSESX|nr:ABC transporter permease [Pseudomonas syringae]OUM06429.1 ABC transporter permease [Pseudomonas syringae]
MLDHSLRHGPSFLQALTESFDSLRMLGRRSLLALLGIAVGCGAIVALLNVGASAANEAVSAFKGMGTEIMVVSFPYSTDQKKTLPAVIDTGALLEALPELAQAAPTVFHSTRVRRSGKSVDASIIGTTAGLAEIMDIALSQGRFLSEFDQRATYAVIGTNMAKALGVDLSANVLKQGVTLQIENYLYTVIGIAAPHLGNPMIAVQVDESVFVPIEGMRRLRSAPEITSVIARSRDTVLIDAHANALKRYLEDLLKGRDVDVQIPQQLIESLTRQASAFSYLLAGLGGISLLVGGAGVMNVMLMSVSERRREIGVRMAIGARASDIRTLFLLEAACLSIAGALIGALAGVLCAYGFVRLSGWTFVLSRESLPVGISSSLIVGLFFGLYPALAAARLQPVQALRDD